MKKNRPTVNKRYRFILFLGILGVSLSGCMTTSQQPMMYPVVIPYYPSGSYGQPQAYPPMAAAQAPMPQPPAPVSYPTPTDYQHMVQNTSEYHQPDLNIYRQQATQNTIPAAPYPSQTVPSISVPLGEQIPSIPVQGIVSVPSNLQQMNQDQRFQMADALFRYLDQDLGQTAKELADVMQPTLEASACGIPWLPEMAARNTKGNEKKAITPLRNTPQHNPGSGCLNVAQVDNWRFVQRGHIAFRVIFESPQSHEKASRRFELIHERDGWHYVKMNELF